MNDDHLDIPKTDETQQPTPEENYFSRSKNQWLLVSDMSDMHVRRAFKRLLRMIRLGQLVELEDKPILINNEEQIKEQVKSIRSHCARIEDILNGD
tara:strand:- start:424 stop:711 length:288 start_codon:yes stop_codon:yes gene_type:complete